MIENSCYQECIEEDGVCVFGFGMIIFLICGALLSPERTFGMYENLHSEERLNRYN